MNRLRIGVMFRTTLFAMISLTVIVQSIDQKEHKPSENPISKRSGTLDNGFSYYIQRDENLKGRILIRLVVKFGNEDVKEEEIEFPHLIEHLATLNTEHFDDVKGFVSNLGLAFGKDFNASTGAKTTDYWINIFSGNPKHVNQALQLFRDIAQGGVTINDNTVGKEKLVVLEEYRVGNEQLERKLIKNYLIQLMGGSECSHHALSYYTSDRSNVKNAKALEIKALYDQWYRPDSEAIIITGDINLEEIQSKVIKQFATEMVDKPMTPGKICPVDLTPALSYTQITDPHVNKGEIRLITRLPYYSDERTQELNMNVLRNLTYLSISKRCSKLNLVSSGISFQSKFNGYGEPFATVTTHVNADSSHFLKHAFVNMQLVVEQLRLYGVTQDELAEAKAAFLANLERDLSTPHALSQRYSNYFLNGGTVNSKQQEIQLNAKTLAAIDTGRIHSEISRWFNGGDRHIVVIGNQENVDILPTKAMILSWLDSVRRSRITRVIQDHEETLTDLIELVTIPKPVGKLPSNELSLPPIGVTQFTLVNGLTVLCKPISPSRPEEKGRIYVGAIKSFRSTKYPKAVTDMVTSVVSRSGVGPYKGDNWRTYKRQKHFSINPFILDNRCGFSGYADRESCKNLLLSVHAYFATPIIDSQEIILYKQNSQLSINKSPIQKFIDSQSDRAVLESSSAIGTEKISLDTISERTIGQIYNIEFSDPSKFTFVIVGDFELSSIKDSLVRYLGTIPLKMACPWVEVHSQNLAPLSDTTFYTGQSGRSAKLMLQYFGLQDYTFEAQLKIEVLSKVLNTALYSTLRDRDGLVYSVSAAGNFSNDEPRLINLYASADCEKSNFEQVASTLKREVLYALNNPSKNQIRAAKLSVQAEYDGRTNDPQFWKEYLLNQVQFQSDLEQIAKMKSLLKSIDRSKIREFSKSVLNNGSTRQVSLISGIERVAN